MGFPDYLFFVIYLFCFMVYCVLLYKYRTVYRFLVRFRQQKVFNIDLGDFFE